MSETAPKDGRPRRSFIPVLGVGLVALLGATLAGFVLYGLIREALSPRTAPVVAASATPTSPSPASPTPRVTIPAEATGIPLELLQEMERIEDQVVELRGLPPTTSASRRLITPQELRQIVEQDFLDDYSPEEAQDDQRVYVLFGLMDPDFDLWNFFLDLYSEQVAGFYDDEAKVMYIVRGSGFGGPERLTYAHEYVHALQDQHFDLRGGLGFDDETCDQDSERCAAVQALVEGDASLVEEQWFRTYATEQDRQEIREFVLSFSSPVLDSSPGFLQESFLFPYQAGSEFVRTVFRRGGWAEVDAIYTQPPMSTEQILHPEHYPADNPVRLSLPQDTAESLGEAWREIDRNALGELSTRQVLEGLLPPDVADQAAEGWGGDSYLAFVEEDSGESALVLVSLWDTIRDSQEAFFAWRDYGVSRFGEYTPGEDGLTWQADSAFAMLERSSDQTLWILAPDAATGARLRQAVPFPAPKR